MLKRALSGAVYVALIVCACLFSRIGFDLLMLVFAVVGIYEFLSVTADKSASIPTRFGILSLDIVAVMSAVLMASAMFIDYPRIDILSFGQMFAYGTLFTLLLVVYVAARVCYALFQRSGNPTRMLAGSLLGICYLSVGLQSAVILNSISNGLVLIVFIFIWLNDTGAYLVGRTFGRHKLCVHLSPKKTWEGFAGGMIFVFAAGVTFSLTGLAGVMMPSLKMLHSVVMLGVVIPLAVVILSTAGDLFESMIKRNAGVKDSGRIIPGHGGVLDRIDSMLFAMPGVGIVILIRMML